MLKTICLIWVAFICIGREIENNAWRVSLACLDTLDYRWLGHGFQEQLSLLETAIERLEQAHSMSAAASRDPPTIVISRASASERSLLVANEEYEQLLRTIRMCV